MPNNLLHNSNNAGLHGSKGEVILENLFVEGVVRLPHFFP